MSKQPKIRAIALGLIENGDRLFLAQGWDAHQQQTFYRALGGGLEFGESSQEALQREFREELQAELTNIEYLGCIENRFTYNNHPGHEIIFVYRAQFTNPHFYQQESFPFMEGEKQKKAFWVHKKSCLSGEILVVPPEFLTYLSHP